MQLLDPTYAAITLDSYICNPPARSIDYRPAYYAFCRMPAPMRSSPFPQAWTWCC